MVLFQECHQIIQKLRLDNIYNQSFKCGLIAANKGDAYAQGNVGWHYQTGNGIAQDNKKAIKWFENKQPSTENLVIFIWEQLCDKIPANGSLHKIKLRETPSIYTEYYGPNGD